MLRKGPNHGAGTKEESDKTQAGHMANIQKMARLGKLIAAGPMGDDGNLRGIFLFKSSREEARALAAEDPAIRAGRLALDLHSWYGPKGIGAKLNEEYRKDSNVKTTMTRYFLALLGKGPKAADAASLETQKLQLEHLWNVRRMLDAKTFAAAGPFNGAGGLRGIFVVAANSLEEARAIVDADPAVKAGQLSVEIHPWWVAKEVWP
ncbi:MAG: YciI family protein [Blastocatellia bacterium]